MAQAELTFSSFYTTKTLTLGINLLRIPIPPTFSSSRLCSSCTSLGEPATAILYIGLTSTGSIVSIYFAPVHELIL